MDNEAIFAVRKEIQTYFKLLGYSFKTSLLPQKSSWRQSHVDLKVDFYCKLGRVLPLDAIQYLLDLLHTFEKKTREDWLSRISQSLQNRTLESVVIDAETLESAVAECSKQNATTEENQIFSVIDVFGAPRIEYQKNRDKLIALPPLGENRMVLHGAPDSKTDLLVRRYEIVRQRVARHELFAPTSSLAEKGAGGVIRQHFRLCSVEELLSSAGGVRRRHAGTNDIVVLGMLTHLKADKFHLEDPTGSIELDLSEASTHTGLFTDGCQVLCEGWTNIGDTPILHVTALGFPPVETADETRKYFGTGVNYFGGISRIPVAESAKLKRLEAERQDTTMVFVSDVNLDNNKVLTGLRRLFEGFSDGPPICFIFCGNFTSRAYGLEQFNDMEEGFRNLANLMLEFPTLVNRTNFVFVPGMEDPLLPNILPRPALPLSLTTSVSERIPNCHFVSNPCRLQYCSQEVVILRENLQQKMCRNAVRLPTEQKDLPQHLTKTLQSQAHLSPLPLHVSPVYWEADPLLQLYPLPDLLLLADDADQFSLEQNRCLVANPGSFAKNNLCFQVYIPATRQIEDSLVKLD